jgi:hypothetical protein
MLCLDNLEAAIVSAFVSAVNAPEWLHLGAKLPLRICLET